MNNNSADEANEVIQRLGGTNKTARLCEVSPQAVSQWRTKGLPKAQRKFLRVKRPDVFKATQPHPDPQPQ
jgi:DNA-binding transcriptional regulator YdaS (Cro superfamily)